MPNKFTVDVGEIQLSPKQVASINAAIQKAVAGELAGVATKKRLALIPIDRFPNGPIINGLIARELNLNDFNKFTR